jgi:hypothetical protein
MGWCQRVGAECACGTFLSPNYTFGASSCIVLIGDYP